MTDDDREFYKNSPTVGDVIDMLAKYPRDMLFVFDDERGMGRFDNLRFEPCEGMLAIQL